MRVLPLDPRVLAHVVRSFDGETLKLADDEVPVYHGNGRLEFTTGFTYEGEFAYGRMHGKGRIEWQVNGVIYEGEFNENEMSGRGTYWWPDGSSYVGDVKCGKRHGHGVFVTGDCGLQEAEAKAEGDGVMAPRLLFNCRHTDEQDGDGSKEVVVIQRNARYEGEWADGLPHGYGELVFDAVRNIRYEGQFIEGKREGRGLMSYADGSTYAGEWQADVKCGRGVMTWMAQQDSDELTRVEDAIPLERYDGEWKDDCQQGFGRHVWLLEAHDASSSMARASQALVSHDKNWYEGEFHEGLRHGQGVFYYANGARYEGEWKANVKDGYGLLFHENGRVFVGIFRQDRSVEGSYATPGTNPTPLQPSPESSMPVAALSPTQVSSSSSNLDGIMLFVNDLLPISELPKREKARKAVEHAALRVNSELRALYRECVKESRRPAASASSDRGDTGALLEIFACRRLLSQCGFYFTIGQLESLMHDIRKAQRASVLACASTMNVADHFAKDLPVENRLRYPMDSCLELVPWNEVLLYREFVELLVRVAYSWVTTAETNGMVELSATKDSTVFLADAFMDLYDQMMRERQKVLHQGSSSWLAQLWTELTDQQVHAVFVKHHDQLQRLYQSCATSSACQPSHDDSEQEHTESDLHVLTYNDDEKVSVRSMLVMLRNVGPHDAPIFTAEFQIRDALSALNQAFASFSPPLKHGLLRSVSTSHSGDESESDAFFISARLVFSEFLDAIAIILFTKQHMALNQRRNESSKPQAPQDLPLYVLLDQYIKVG